MKIVSWNCHYGMTNEKAKKLADFADADIYFVQETEENDTADHPEIEKYLGQRKCWYGDHKEYDLCGGRGDLGIAIFSRDYTVKRFYKGTERFRYVVPYEITKNDGSEKFYALHVWTKKFPNYYENAVIEALKVFDDEIFKNAIMIGDFNFGRLLKPENGDQKLLAEKFNEAIISRAGFKLVDNGLNDESWTYKHTNSLHYLNDCCFVSAEWKAKNLSIGDENSYYDHLPILVELEK